MAEGNFFYNGEFRDKSGLPLKQVKFATDEVCKKQREEAYQQFEKVIDEA